MAEAWTWPLLLVDHRETRHVPGERRYAKEVYVVEQDIDLSVFTSKHDHVTSVSSPLNIILSNALLTIVLSVDSLVYVRQSQIFLQI